MSYIPTYSEAEGEIISDTLNLSNYVTKKKEFKNVTKVDTSNFALKTNVAEIKKKVGGIDDKIDFFMNFKAKNYIDDIYLYFKPEHRYFEITGIKSVLSWKSIGLSDEKLKSIGDYYSPELWYDKEITYLNFRNDVLAQEKISYTHDHTVNLYIIYSMPYITCKSDPDTIGRCFFGAKDYNNKK